jgi:predicted Zn-dependent protease
MNRTLRLSAAILLLALFAPWPPAAFGDDLVFRAMSDELERSMDQLVIEGMEKPYFISYLVQDNDTVTLEARYGAVLNREVDHERFLYTQVRVGSPALDNTGYIGGWRSMGNARTRMVAEDDYNALRHQIWLATDSNYKLALENLAGKQSYLQAHPVREPLDDFSAAEQLVRMDEPAVLKRDLPGWEDRVRLAAQTLGEFPALQDWRVRLYAVALNKRYLNSEGSRHLKGRVIVEFEISATTQAADGQRLTNFQRYMTAAGDELPAGDRLVADMRVMAVELQRLAAAEVLESYSGPVLFSGEAAAQFIAQLFAGQLSPPCKPLLANEWMSRSFPDPKLAGKMNRRVFPEFVTILDDPTRDSWEGRQLAGCMPVDDEGVASRPVALVERGRLTGLPMGRQPTREIPVSNGHVWASPVLWPMPTTTNLFVETSNPVSGLIDELRRLAGEFGLEYGLLVTRLDEPRFSLPFRRGSPTGDTSGRLLSAPLALYKVYVEEDRVEPVRGLVFDEVTVRAMRDVGMLGDDPRSYNMRFGSQSMSVMIPGSIVTPSILVEEIDLREETTRETVLLSANPMFGE